MVNLVLDIYLHNISTENTFLLEPKLFFLKLIQSANMQNIYIGPKLVYTKILNKVLQKIRSPAFVQTHPPPSPHPPTVFGY